MTGGFNDKLKKTQKFSLSVSLKQKSIDLNDRIKSVLFYDNLEE